MRWPPRNWRKAYAASARTPSNSTPCSPGPDLPLGQTKGPERCAGSGPSYWVQDGPPRTTRFFLRLELLRDARLGSPGQHAVFHHRHSPIEHQGKDRQHDDTCKHGIHIERAFGLKDQVADPARGTQVFTDHRTNEGQANRSMQAGEHPAGCRWDIHVTQQLLAVSAQHAGVIQQRARDFAYTLVDVEEHDEEHER